MSVTQLTDQELDEMGNPDKPFRIQSRLHWEFRDPSRTRAGVWAHWKCYRSRSAMERGLAHLKDWCDWSEWSGPNPDGTALRYKREFRIRELTEFPEIAPPKLQTLKARIEVLERQRDGLVKACNKINARSKAGSWAGCMTCDHGLPCTRDTGCLGNPGAHEHELLRPVRTILQEIAQEQEARDE